MTKEGVGVCFRVSGLLGHLNLDGWSWDGLASSFAIEWAGDREKWSPHGHGSRRVARLRGFAFRHWAPGD